MFWLRQVMDRCDTGDLVLEPEQERYGECGTGGENLMRFNSEECHLNYTQTPRSELCILRDTVVMKVDNLYRAVVVCSMGALKSLFIEIR